jgi:hypothetical protein
VRDVWLLRLRALLAQSRSDTAAYAHLGTAIATWRKRLASKGISRGPRRCHKDGRSGVHLRPRLETDDICDSRKSVS